MNGISKLLLVPVGNVEDILTHQRRDFMNDSSFFWHILNNRFGFKCGKVGKSTSLML